MVKRVLKPLQVFAFIALVMALWALIEDVTSESSPPVACLPPDACAP